MKIVVLSDIHGNIPALQTAIEDIDRWRPDQVVVNGDVVNRGPCSAVCLDIILEKQAKDGWHLLRGNHEDFILHCATIEDAEQQPDFELNQFAHWAYRQIGAKKVAHFKDWGEVFSWLAPDGSEFRTTHAAMGNNRKGIFQRMSDEEIEPLITPPPAVFVTSHTHEPLMRDINSAQVVNIGSIGASFDRDRRLCYGRFTYTKAKGWQSELRRLEYDYAQIERDYVDSGFLTEAGVFSQLMLIEHRRAGGLFFRWAKRYIKQVEAGEATVADTVRELLKDEDLRPYLGAPGWSFEMLSSSNY
ncbi:MAG: metallophosphoesterase [Chloroflexota bacterium]